MTPSAKRYRVARDIVIPKGHRVVFIGRMKHDILEAVHAVVKAGPDKNYDWFMGRADALEAGLIEEVPET